MNCVLGNIYRTQPWYTIEQDTTAAVEWARGPRDLAGNSYDMLVAIAQVLRSTALTQSTYPSTCLIQGGMAVAKSEKDFRGSPLLSVTQLVP